MINNLYFIDALSIDQSNIVEKGHQVKLMGGIYSRASEVIIWLGLPAPDDPLLHEGLQLLRKRPDWTTTDENRNDAESHALSVISECPYWERM